MPLPRKMLFHQGLPGAAVKTPAEDVRLNDGGMFVAGANNDAIKVRSGVIYGPGTGAFTPCQVIAQSGQVTVKTGRVIVQGSAANQGHYVGTIDADVVRTVAAATVGAGLPAAGQFKAGRVIVRVYDQLYDGGTTDGWDVEIHCGSAAATAGAAALPPVVNNSFTLKTFTVDSAGAITLGGVVPMTGLRGGITAVPSGDTTPGTYDGEYRDYPGVGLQRWNASATRWDSMTGMDAPTLRLRCTSGQAIPNATWTNISWNVRDSDTHAMWSSGSSITIRRSGTYFVEAGWAVANSASGRRIVTLWRNGTTQGTIGRAGVGDGSSPEVGAECSGLLVATVGDVITAAVYQNTGASQTIASPAYSPCNLNMIWLRG